MQWSSSITFHLRGSCEPLFYICDSHMNAACPVIKWTRSHLGIMSGCRYSCQWQAGNQVRMSKCMSAEACLPWLPLSPVIRHSTAQVSDSLSPFLYSQSPKICRFSNVTPIDMQHDLNVCNTRLFAIWNAISSTRTLKMVTPAPFDWKETVLQSLVRHYARS